MRHRTMHAGFLAIAIAIVGLTTVANSPADAAAVDRCKTKCNQDYWLKCLKRTRGTDDYVTRKCQQDRDFCEARCEGN